MGCLILQNETHTVSCLICLISLSKMRPEHFRFLIWTYRQKTLTIPYICGFQTRTARQYIFLAKTKMIGAADNHFQKPKKYVIIQVEKRIKKLF